MLEQELEQARTEEVSIENKRYTNEECFSLEHGKAAFEQVQLIKCRLCRGEI